MFVSVFDLFKIGVGPSSSHTMGPTLAAGRFMKSARENSGQIGAGCALKVTLFGSLAHTGVGHGTLRAVTAGLLGFLPRQEVDKVSKAIARLTNKNTLPLSAGASIGFDPETGFELDKKTRKTGHPNALSFEVIDLPPI